MAEDWRGLILSLDSIDTGADANDLGKAIATETKDALEMWIGFFAPWLDELLELDAEVFGQAIESVITGPLTYASLLTLMLPTGGQRRMTGRQWINAIVNDAVRDSKNLIVSGYQRGLEPSAIAREAVGTRSEQYKNGLTYQIKRSISGFVRTAVVAVKNYGRVQYLKRVKKIKFWQFSAVLDDRTSAICVSNHGRIWPVGEGRIPPLHPYCRSTVMPIVSGSQETRQGVQWLRAQPKSRQEAILGKEAATIFAKATDAEAAQILRMLYSRRRPLAEIKRKYPELVDDE